METRLIQSPAEAGLLLREGKIVAFPTDTVFGLGAKATSTAAVERIFEAKGRPSDNPLIVHLSHSKYWNDAAAVMTEVGDRLLKAFSPGPITVVLPKSDNLPAIVTAGLPTVGIRVPACAIARQVLEAAGVPIAAPSANRSGRPSATTWQAVYEDLNGHIDAILCADTEQQGVESTVVDCAGSCPVVLRPGGIPLEAIRTIFPEAKLASNLSQSSSDSVVSPGTRHPHYQPNAKVITFESPPLVGDQMELLGVAPSDCAIAGLNIKSQHDLNDGWRLRRKFESLETYAAGFYEFLRESDRAGAKVVLIELAAEVGIGSALRDRQLRAAGPRN